MDISKLDKNSEWFKNLNGRIEPTPISRDFSGSAYGIFSDGHNRGGIIPNNILRNTYNNPNIKVVSLKDRETSGWSKVDNNVGNIATIMDHAISHSIRIINFANRFGDDDKSTKFNKEENKELLRTAIQNFGNANGLMIVTAGWRGDGGREINDSFPHYPTSLGLDNVITVAMARVGNDNIARLMGPNGAVSGNMSNWGGQTVDLVADFLLSTDTVASSYMPSEVSRVAAMIMYERPSLSALQVRYRRCLEASRL